MEKYDNLKRNEQLEEVEKQPDILKRKISEFSTILVDLIESCNKVYITTHMYPDYDGIASMGAIALICKKYKKTPDIVIDEQDYKNLDYNHSMMLQKIKEKFVVINMKDYEANKVENSLLIVVDVNQAFRTPLKNNLDDFSNIIIIDHHHISDDTIRTKFRLITSDVSSCSEISYWLLKKFEVVPSDFDYYTFLRVGINLDTDKGDKGMFESTHNCFGELKGLGVDDKNVDLYFTRDFDEDKKLNKMVDDNVFWKTFRYALVIANQDVYTHTQIAKASDRLVKYTCEAAFVFGKTADGSYHGCARTRLANVNIGNVMKQMFNGGGGNKFSAACEPFFVDADSPEREVEIIKEKLYEILYHQKVFNSQPRKRYYIKSRRLGKEKTEDLE